MLNAGTPPDRPMMQSEWVDFMNEHEAFGIRSISKDRTQIFMIILDDGMSMFCRKDYEAVVMVWDHADDFEDLE